MGNAHKPRRDSIACVLDKPLGNNDSDEDLNINPNSPDYDLISDLKRKVKLPIENENEFEEIKQIPNVQNENKIKNNYISDNKIKLSPNKNIHESRSKSMVCDYNISLFNAPKQKIKIFNEPIIPFKLSNKTYGGSQWKTKKPNSLMLHLSDSKSCNDTENTTEDIFYDNDLELDNEVNIPNPEDIKDLSNCRKKMAIFRDSISNKSDHSFKEEEQIENILDGKKNKNNKQNKKNNFWIKHIRQQMRKSDLSMRFSRISDAHIKKSATMGFKAFKDMNENLNGKENDDDDLFILGVLESAAKEKKMKKKLRYTTFA